MVKDLEQKFESLKDFINQLEGARFVDENGREYTMTNVRPHSIPWSGDIKKILYTAEYDDGETTKVAILGEAYTKNHKFAKNSKN